MEPKIRCGTTCKGLPIFEFPKGKPDGCIHPEHLQFDSNDHFDAYALFQYKCRNAIDSDISAAIRYDDQAEAHLGAISDMGKFQSLLSANKIHTIFDVISFGARLAWPTTN